MDNISVERNHNGWRRSRHSSDRSTPLWSDYVQRPHYFCKRCGVRTHGVGTDTPIGVMVGVNLGCLEDVADEELARTPITYVEGRNDRFAAPVHYSHL